MSLQVANAMARYFASALDYAMTFYFFMLGDKDAPNKYIQHPKVNLILARGLAQSVSDIPQHMAPYFHKSFRGAALIFYKEQSIPSWRCLYNVS